MSKHVTRMTIEDAEHLSREQIDAIIASYPPHERDARVKGIPALGSGRVYPVAEDAITVEPFEIPKHFAQIGGIDFGWTHPTAAVRLAHDRDADIVYVTHCYRVKEQPPLIHAAALKAWGKIPFSWPHDGYQKDKRSGIPLKEDYEAHGLNMLYKNAAFDDGSTGVEAGLMLILERMQTGRFKVFANCADWLDEFRLYHRDEGIVVKEYDDLMDATRYAIMNLRDASVIKPKDTRDRYARAASKSGGGHSAWAA